jgi:glycosyltransferase involved in cell wall biosynthesis
MPFAPQEILWVTWEGHRRTRTLASRLGIPLVELSAPGSRLTTHPVFAWRTLQLLLHRRPRVLVVQNPSGILTLLAVLWRPLLRYRLVVDAHNAGVYPFEPAYDRFARVFPFLHRHTDRTIVTNEPLAEVVRRNGGRASVLPDALPDLASHLKVPSQARPQVGFVLTFVCTFAADEPYGAVFQASRMLPDDICIQVTGNPRGADPDVRATAGPNVHLTGFLPDDEYVALLAASDAVIDLTSHPDCLVCGAYEATALGRPMILSDTPALRAYFRRGAIYTDHTPEGLAAAILRARAEAPRLLAEVGALRTELATEWERDLAPLLQELSTWAVSARR